MSVASAGAGRLPGAMPPQRAAIPSWAPESSRGWVVGLMAWLLLAVMIVPDNFDYVGALSGEIPTQGSTLSRTIWLVLLATGVLVILSRAWLAWQLIRSINPFLLLFAALAIASITWSIDPAVTARRCVRVVTILADAFALVLVGWHPRRFQGVLRPAITTALVGSIVFGLAAPELAIHSELSPELAGAWHGLANHKNGLGALSCIGLIFWVHAWFARDTARWKIVIGLAISITCLVLSRSSTSLMVTVLTLTFLLLLQQAPRTLRPYMPYFIAAFVTILLFYSLVILRLIPASDVFLKPITYVTGKDLSFTGRADIWEIMLEHVRYHPLLGTGLGAFWTGPYIGTPSYLFFERLKFYPGSAHNGYLEITNDLGFIGLACLAGFLICYVYQALKVSKFDHVQSSLFLALFLQQALTNLSETHWLSVLSVGFVIMTFATAAIGRSLLAHKVAMLAALREQQQRRQEEAGSPTPSPMPPRGARHAARA
jgi:exopolysaccharide production protein ExoQ